MYLAEYTGKGVLIAVIDSGVHAAHPHVRGVAGGMAIREDGTILDEYVDRLGHGTAVMRHRDQLAAAVARARSRNAIIVAANDDGGVRWLPGCLEDVMAVRAD